MADLYANFALIGRIYLQPQELHLIKGDAKRKKNSLNLCHSFCSPSLARNMLEDWKIIHLKGEIHSSVWSTKTFLYDIRELRYKQNNMRYQISRIINNDQSDIVKSDTAAVYA